MTKKEEKLQAENEDLRRQLAEAEEALAAIRAGEVDAIVVDGATGEQIFSLRSAETVYRLAVETMAEAAINVSPKGIILFCNSRFSEFVATPMEQLLGRNITGFLRPEDQEDFRLMLRSCCNQPIRRRIVLYGSDGRRRPVYLSGTALTAGEDVSVCLVAADLTELESSSCEIELLREQQRQLEEIQAELRRSKMSLEETVLVRTAALKQSEEALRLLSAQVLAAQEEERKLVAMELHDSIAASLSVIKMKLQRLTPEKDEPADVQRSLEEAVTIVGGTVGEVRRIMANLRPSMLDDLGLLPAIKYHCREFQKLYPECSISVDHDVTENDIPQELKIVIFRVMQEALNNVGKHSQAKRASVFLGVKEGQLILEINDNGRGFSVREPRVSVKTDSGFGLSSMQERVRLSGGSFVVISSRGNGTAIRAYWPGKQAAEAVLSVVAPEAPANHSAREGTHPAAVQRVLLVEDNAVYRKTFKDTLLAQFPSLQIEEAPSGSTALEIVRQLQPQLIFMDIHLPGENGLVVTRNIKEMAPEATVIMLTSHDTAEYRQAAADAGASGFLVKDSWSMKDIAALVRPGSGVGP